MQKLLSMTNYRKELQWYNNSFSEIEGFLNKNGFGGIELVQFGAYSKEQIPKEKIKGFHMRFYPSWIDLWRGDREKLLQKYGSMENVEMLYGGMDKRALLDYYREEVEIASELGVEYVVMHVCHVDFNETYSYDFEYSDEEIIEASIELINEIFHEDLRVKLLLENLWWPGLKLKNKDIMRRLIEGINYKNIGFMLDTGHMVNTNLEIKDGEEAGDYILKSLHHIEEFREYIKGIHLNCSITGEYVKKVVAERKNADDYSFEEVFKIVYGHVSNIDTHKPFESEKVQKIIDWVEPEFLVYEFLASSKEELQEMIHKQDRYVR